MITAEQVYILNQIERETIHLVLRGVTDAAKIAEQMAIKYFDGSEDDEMIEMIGDTILYTKYSVLN
jgi:uncharacterized protein (DUF1810 family)